MVFFITFLFTENTISPIRSGNNIIWTYNCTTWFTIGHFFYCQRKVIKKTISSSKLNHKSLIRFLGDYIVKHINQNSYFYLLVYDLQQDLWYFTTKLSDTTWVIEDTSTINRLYTSSWRTSAALIKVSLPLSVKTYNVQMILLPDLIGLIVFSVKRKVIKKNISSSKLNHKSLIRFLGDYIVKHINQNIQLIVCIPHLDVPLRL
jgi:hypothetical protein